MSKFRIRSFTFASGDVGPNDQFIRHQNFEGELNTLDPGHEEDFLFELEEGTMDFAPGDKRRTVRFKSVNFPTRFLRHKDFRLHLDDPPSGGPFIQDSTFFNEESPLGLFSENWRRFRAVNVTPANLHDRFIRHRDFHVFLDVVGNDQLALKDSTFQLVKAD